MTMIDDKEELEQDYKALMDSYKAYIKRVLNGGGQYDCHACKYGGDPYKEPDAGSNCPEGCDGWKHWKWRGAKRKKPIRYITPCPYCGDPNVVVTDNMVADDYKRGEIIQERTCPACGKKRYVRLIYKLMDVKPIKEEDLPKG